MALALMKLRVLLLHYKVRRTDVHDGVQLTQGTGPPG